jgi:hypothetical protein
MQQVCSKCRRLVTMTLFLAAAQAWKIYAEETNLAATAGPCLTSESLR